MKKIVWTALLALPLSPFGAVSHSAAPKSNGEIKSISQNRKPFAGAAPIQIQQNLIGEISSIDVNGGKLIITTEAKINVTAAFDGKTVFKRVLPGQSSLTNAEQIKVSDLKAGDRVLIPDGAAGENAPVKQIIVMGRADANAQRASELEKRRARTFVGRITDINAGKKEISVRTRRRDEDAAETLTIAAAENSRLLRYAPDSLKTTNAVAGSFADLRVGDQVRVIGDRNAQQRRVTAEEIVSGSLVRSVGNIEEINQARGDVVVKDVQTNQLTPIAVGKNTLIRRLTAEMVESLKQRFEKRADTQNQPRSSSAAERQNAAAVNRRQQLENLPAMSIGELKKGDAVLIMATKGGAANSRTTAVSIITGDGELAQIMQRAQANENADLDLSTGLPGNVSGGNALIGDDEPFRK